MGFIEVDAAYVVSGVALVARRSILNFVGVTVTDDPTSNRIDVDVGAAIDQFTPPDAAINAAPVVGSGVPAEVLSLNVPDYGQPVRVTLAGSFAGVWTAAALEHGLLQIQVDANPGSAFLGSTLGSNGYDSGAAFITEVQLAAGAHTIKLYVGTSNAGGGPPTWTASAGRACLAIVAVKPD